MENHTDMNKNSGTFLMTSSLWDGGWEKGARRVNRLQGIFGAGKRATRDLLDNNVGCQILCLFLLLPDACAVCAVPLTCGALPDPVISRQYRGDFVVVVAVLGFGDGYGHLVLCDGAVLQCFFFV